MPKILEDIQLELLRTIQNDRVRAHEYLFRHRHPLPTAPFQKEMIEATHGPHPRVVIEAFRKAAKSTIVAEEGTIVQAGLTEFRNCLLIGASYERACERLESIKHEIENNDDLEQAFGVLKSTSAWANDKIVLTNGVCIQAKGAGQSLRGVKHLAQPPDYVVIDDLEDEDSVRTPEARNQMLRWLYATLMPAVTREARIRLIGNRLDPEAVIVKIMESVDAHQQKIWKHLYFPIMHKDLKTGEDVATWPQAYPLDWIYTKREELQRQGLFEVFNQEYMVEADTPEARIFRPEHFANVVKGRTRTWEATWAMVDPARSIGKRSATTAIPVWSWVNNRLVVWDCLIGHWLPDEIIAKMLKVNDEYGPVAIGVEEDALNQFILQPLRQAMVKQGTPLPLRAMSAKRFTQGRGKEDFIKSLQPFFAAGEVEFAKDLPELKAQFLSFPKGQIDGPNALAYALKMRPGAVMYDDFSRENIVEEAALSPLLPVYLVMNATQAYVTAALVQHDGKVLKIAADYVDEGDPGQIAASIVRRAQIECSSLRLRVMAHPRHFDQWANVGLRAALAKVPVDCTQGGDPVAGREEIRALMRSSVRGLTALQVGRAAHWTLNALAGGYCRALSSGGVLGGEPEDNLYATLMAGLESFCALTRIASGPDFNDTDNVRVARDGHTRYRSAMVDRDR